MVKKKIDSRVRTLVENGVALNHRTLYVLVGDKGKDQIVNLHFMLSKASVKARPNVLWCYKKELGFSTHRKKRMKEIKKKMKAGLIDPDKNDPFDLFISATDIRWCYYNETHKILGNTYGMCVLQDFEALTPNLLARTIETVEGGGIVVLLLRTVKSLKQLYTMAMDVHGRFRTEAHQDVVPRFNERFLLSLKDMPHCLMLDDTLDVLPWARQTLTIEPVRIDQDVEDADAAQLKEWKASLQDTQPAGSLVALAKTLDQAKVILSFIEAISEKTLRSTISLTAARGRGKSAALGLSIAAAVSYGYSNIFVTSPSPENLKTLFDFVFKGFDALNYEEHTDYELVQSTNPDFNKAIVRVNIFGQNHRQTIQYIQPQDAAKLGQAELLVIDEAAAIPLPLVKSLLGSYLVFLASTINGYEGTGRSLSLKLIAQLRKESAGLGGAADGAATTVSGLGNRVLRELTLETPIRYEKGDPVEKWMNELLCLDASVAPPSTSGCPHPSKCDLYIVERDSLFSFNKVSEIFLQRLMALYVASHYKNTPNDLQMLSDAPAHRIFCLLGPVNSSTSSLPEILCVVQIALEGKISRESVAASLRKGIRASGDLIPWTIAQQYQDDDFASLSGARVVRIATHPDYQGMGYGKRALEQLRDYYEGKFADLTESSDQTAKDVSSAPSTLKPRSNLPPLLRKLSECQPDALDYIGVSFGLTQQLLRFWKSGGFTPVYVRQTPNDLTGENTCIMVRPINSTVGTSSIDWAATYWEDFQRRFVTLLGFTFRSFPPLLALSVLQRSKVAITASDNPKPQADNPQTTAAAMRLFSKYDLKRLHSYANQSVDFHVIMDLVPKIAQLYYLESVSVNLSPVQQAILLGMGLQYKSVEELEEDFKSHNQSLSVSHILAMFSQVIKRFSKYLRKIQQDSIGSVIPKRADQTMGKGAGLKSLDEEQVDAAAEATEAMKTDTFRLTGLGEFAVMDDDRLAEVVAAAKDGEVPKSVSAKRKKGKEEKPKRPKTADSKRKSEGGKDKHKKKKKAHRTSM